MTLRNSQFLLILKVIFICLLFCGLTVYYLIVRLDRFESELLKNWMWKKRNGPFVYSQQTYFTTPIDNVMTGLINQVKISDVNNEIDVDWNATISWASARHVHPKFDSRFPNVLHKMATAEIIEADVGTVGTQIKMMLTLRGNQKVLFKPMVVPRDYVAYSSPYAGVDRHNCEIASFHLNRLLDFRRCPLVIGRKINLEKEILPIATERLKKTFLTQGNKTCFYGVCYYCQPKESVCASENGLLEGAVVLWMPYKLKKFKNPWARTYRKHVRAKWETNKDYCDLVKSHVTYRHGPRLLDLIDASIFDFLTGNADRHHYEVPLGSTNGVVLLLDNGKSFGNPYHDELSILAPLYQCCRLRKSTWLTLKKFSGPRNALSKSLKVILSSEPLSPILTEDHLTSLDRRLESVFSEVKKCVKVHGHEVIIDDGQ